MKLNLQTLICLQKDLSFKRCEKKSIKLGRIKICLDVVKSTWNVN